MNAVHCTVAAMLWKIIVKFKSCYISMRHDHAIFSIANESDGFFCTDWVVMWSEWVQHTSLLGKRVRTSSSMFEMQTASYDYFTNSQILFTSKWTKDGREGTELSCHCVQDIKQLVKVENTCEAHHDLVHQTLHPSCHTTKIDLV